MSNAAPRTPPDEALEILRRIEPTLMKIEERLSVMETRLSTVERDVGELKVKATGIEDKLGARIGGLEDKLGARIGGLEDKLGARVGSLEDKLGARVGGLDDRVRKVEIATAVLQWMTSVIVAGVIALVGKTFLP